MISINKQGNAIVIEFTDNDKYLFNGKIEIAPNELIVVVDESDMVTFKRASNGDVLFSQLVDDIQIAGSSVTKDNIIEQFASIGYGTSGAGAVTSVNGQTGDVVLTASSLDVYTKSEADQKFASKTWNFTGATAFLTTETTSAGITVVGGTISYDEVSVGDIVILDNDYYFTVLNKFADTYGNHVSILPLYNAATGDGTSIISYVMNLQSSSSADASIWKANIPVSTVFTARANKSLRVNTDTNGAISLSGWTGYNSAKPGDVVNITYSSQNWNLVVTGKYKDNTGTYLALSGLGDIYTGYRISKNLMYSYVPFDKNMDAAIVIGSGASSYGGTKYAVAIGVGAATTGTNAVAIGSYGATANANATAIGAYASANEEGTTVIGANLKANKQDGSTIEKVLVGYYDAANSTSVPVLAYNETDGARIRSGNSLKSIATKEELDAKIGDIDIILDSLNGEVV